MEQTELKSGAKIIRKGDRGYCGDCNGGLSRDTFTNVIYCPKCEG